MATVVDAEVEIPTGSGHLTASVSWAQSPSRAGIVLLHPSADGSRRQFLFDHLAACLPSIGVSVLRYDRRPGAGRADVPYSDQHADARAALRWLASELGPVPVGLWGFSQGAWVAMVAAAADPTVAFLVLVGASAVSPAAQMRFGTAEQLRRAGYGASALDELSRLRGVWEHWQRGAESSHRAQAVIDELVDRPWFDLAWVPAVLPAEPAWSDMDFDPADSISRLSCAVLAFYGEDEWVPVADSVDVWRRHFPDPTRLTLHHLAGARHHPTVHDARTVEAISPDYATTLISWLDFRISTRG